ncbi:MAG: hypothetical protein QXS02_05590 [Candidatus Thermoplasmatota archaeon]
MKIKNRNQVLHDIIEESKRYPRGWKAAFGKDHDLFSFDYYICHPKAGVYLLKEFHKNPYTIKGVGGKIARSIDDDIINRISKKTSDFGIIQGDIQKIMSNINRGIHPYRIIEEGLKGNDLGITIPVKGKASSSVDTFTFLRDAFSSNQKKLDRKLEKMISEDGIYQSYG